MEFAAPGFVDTKGVVQQGKKESLFLRAETGPALAAFYLPRCVQDLPRMHQAHGS